MNGLLFLSSEDFKIQNGTKGKILCNNVAGFSLILFYSTRCEHCQTLLPVFKSLPGTIMNCYFGMINVNNNKECIQMSKVTIAPIQYVPYIILYYDGIPYMVYNGPRTAEDIRNFIMDVTENVQKRQKFAKKPPEKEESKGIPAYTVGHPVCGNDNVCYLDFAEAYHA